MQDLVVRAVIHDDFEFEGFGFHGRILVGG